MATMGQLRRALAASIDAWLPAGRRNVYPVLQPNPTLPAIQIAGLERVTYHNEATAGSRWSVIVQAISAGAAFSPTAQDQLDAWVSEEGDQSLVAAIESDPTLGGLCDDVTVRECRGYDLFLIGGNQVLGCDLLVELVL